MDIQHHLLKIQYVCRRAGGFDDRDDFNSFFEEGGVIYSFPSTLVARIRREVYSRVWYIPKQDIS